MLAETRKELQPEILNRNFIHSDFQEQRVPVCGLLLYFIKLCVKSMSVYNNRTFIVLEDLLFGGSVISNVAFSSSAELSDDCVSKFTSLVRARD